MIILPKSDVAMKELFRNKTILRYFLSDVLEIDQADIHSIQLRDTFLRRRRRWQKYGILDVVVELNNDTKINIELQVKNFERWDKRQIFYLARLYSEDLASGEDYDLLKRCVGISILDFNLSSRPEYHSVYRLRDKEGNEFSDALEIHVLELNKKLSEQNGVEDWIRFFNSKTEEDLDMIKSNNPGIMEAIWELRRMSLRNPLRLWYEAYVKRARDERAWKKYVEKQAREKGMEEGRAAGKESKLVELVCKKLRKGKNAETIAEELEEDLKKVQGICELAKPFGPEYDSEKVFKAFYKEIP